MTTRRERLAAWKAQKKPPAPEVDRKLRAEAAVRAAAMGKDALAEDEDAQAALATCEEDYHFVVGSQLKACFRVLAYSFTPEEGGPTAAAAAQTTE